MIYDEGVRQAMPENNQEQLDLKRQKKIEIARANGAKSRGPVTPEGKSRSSQNARKDGRYAKTRTRYGNHTIVLANEDLDAYNEHLARHINRFQPADPVELRIVEDIAAIDWRLVRGAAVQTRLADREMEIQTRALGPVPGSVQEVTRLAAAEIALNGKPAFIHHVRNTMQFIRARNQLITTLTNMRKSFEFIERTNQIVDPPALLPENEPKTNRKRTKNEPKSNRKRTGNEPTVLASDEGLPEAA
jgi:hypothetical protein